MDTWISISWDEPCNNNLPIISYMVYLGTLKIKDAKSSPKVMWDLIETIDWFSEDPGFEGKIESRYTISGLKPNFCYYVKVTAVNEKGEGYHAKEPYFIKTMEDKINSSDSLFVWGYNARNEIGLPDSSIDDFKADYIKNSMTKPLQNPMFNNLTY